MLISVDLRMSRLGIDFWRRLVDLLMVPKKFVMVLFWVFLCKGIGIPDELYIFPL